MPEIAKKAKELGLTNNNLINFDNIEISNEVGKNMKEKDIEFINKKMNKVEELEKRVERLNVNLYRYRVMEEKIKTMKQRLEKISNEVKESKDNKPYLITFKDSNIANDIDNIEQESKKLFRTRVNADRYNKIGKEIERVVAIEEGLKRDIKRLYINRRGEDKEETERKSKQFYAKLVKYSEKKERLKKEFKRLSIKMDKNKKDIKTIKEWREKEKESKKRQNVVNNRQREEIE
jgi:hypothetical protein